MITTNTMEGGMNKDISKFRQQQNTYTNATNFRLQTTKGKSFGSIETIKGNKLDFTVPYLYNVRSLTITGVVSGNLTINGDTFSTTGANIQTGEDLNDFILANYNVTSEALFEYTNGVLTPPPVPAASFYGDDFVYIQGLTQNTTIVLGGAGLSLSTPVVEQANSAPIGYTPIREELMLFTTLSVSWNPFNIGQIWRISFNETIGTVAMYLFYNNHFGLSSEYPIMEEAVGFYDRLTYQTIYWTDNKNSFRKFTFNNDTVTTTEPFCIAPELLNVFPNTSFSKPVLQSIQLGGSLTSGTKQYAYRCTNAGGAAESCWSELSNIINVIGADENSAQYNSYFPFGTDTNKSVTMKIEDIDTNFDKIEIACVEKVSDNGNPLVRIIKQDNLSKTGTYIFTHYGSESTIEITLNEFLAFNNTFDTCKTIATKNNHLFAANTTKNTFDPGNIYDTRAYRFPVLAANSALLDDIDSNLEYTINGLVPNYPTISDQLDAINPDETVYRYQQGGSGVLGGTGPNISYEFGTKEVFGDDYSSLAMLNSAGDITSSDGFVKVNRITNTVTIDATLFTNTNTPNNFQSPYVAGLKRGYWLGETYRFAIVFYDKQGVPGYANWIADIKFPNMADTNSSPGYYAGLEGITDFRNSFISTTLGGTCVLQVPYIKFNLDNLSLITDQISAYSIVRVEREEADKTILGQGVLYATNDVAGDLYRNYGVTNNLYLGDTSFTIQCPDHLFNRTSFLPGSTLKILSRLTLTSNTSAASFGIRKQYGCILTTPTTYTISQMNSCEIPTTDTVAITNPVFYNYKYNGGSSPYEMGSKTLVVFLSAPVTQASSIQELLLVNIERNSSGRYGGSGYSARTNNIYIGCGHYRTDLSDPTTGTEVFGGDCFISCFTNQIGLKNWATNWVNSAFLEGNIHSFPVCSTVNCELRSGVFPNHTPFTDTAVGTVDTGEDYSYNGVFSNPMDIRQYFAKPFRIPDVNVYDTRVYASDLKIAGEINDSWGVFRPNNFIDVENYYGAITDILEHNDKLLVIQPKGISNISVNPRSLIQDNSGAQLVLGTGTLLSRYDYIDQYSGSIHQNSVLKTPKGVYFFDMHTSKLMFYNNSLSDVKGMHGWLLQNIIGDVEAGADNSLQAAGICSTYDYENKECWFTFNLKNTITLETFKYTLVYNELFEVFSGFYSHTPYMYINMRNRIYSPHYVTGGFSNSISKNIYRHDYGDECKFYDTVYPANIEFIVNEHPTQSKLYQSVRFHTDTLNTSNINLRDVTFDNIECYNDYQATSILPLTVGSNIGRYQREWRTAIPKNAIKDALYDVDLFDSANYDLTRTYREDLLDMFLYIKLYYTPENVKLIMNYLNTEYLPSPR